MPDDGLESNGSIEDMRTEWLVDELRNRGYEVRKKDQDLTDADFWKNHPDPTGHHSRYDPLG